VVGRLSREERERVGEGSLGLLAFWCCPNRPGRANKPNRVLKLSQARAAKGDDVSLTLTLHVYTADSKHKALAEASFTTCALLKSHQFNSCRGEALIVLPCSSAIEASFPPCHYGADLRHWIVTAFSYNRLCIRSLRTPYMHVL
jgi:hypothetical protein